jgi:hypothetical protein
MEIMNKSNSFQNVTFGVIVRLQLSAFPALCTSIELNQKTRATTMDKISKQSSADVVALMMPN